MEFKARVIHKVSHVHITIFVAPDKDKTWANAGTIVLRDDEWPEFSEKLHIPFEMDTKPD